MKTPAKDPEIQTPNPDGNDALETSPPPEEEASTAIQAKVIEATEIQRFGPLRDAINKLESNDRETLHFRSIINSLIEPELTEEYRHSTIKVQLIIFTKDWGKKKDNTRCVPAKNLKHFYEMIQEYLKYFGEIVEKDWQNEMLRRIVAECLNPINIAPLKDNDPDWLVQDYSERTKLTKEINSRF